MRIQKVMGLVPAGFPHKSKHKAGSHQDLLRGAGGGDDPAGVLGIQSTASSPPTTEGCGQTERTPGKGGVTEKVPLPHVHPMCQPDRHPKVKETCGSLNPLLCGHERPVSAVHKPWRQVQRLPLQDGKLLGPGGWVGGAHRGTDEETEAPRGQRPQCLIGPKKRQRLPGEVTQLVHEEPRTKSRTLGPGPRFHSNHTRQEP